MSGPRRTYGVMTDRWGWQPAAWMEAGLATFAWRRAPAGLVTRRQMRAAGLAPGGAEPVAQITCRRGRIRALLFDRNDLASKRVATPGQLAAVGKAIAARRWCPDCRADVGYCVPTSLGRCIACHYPDPDSAAAGLRDSGTAGLGASVTTDDLDRPAARAA